MSDIKNLENQQAIEKITELAQNKPGLLCTYIGEFAIKARPMSTQAVEKDGSMWFFSSKVSNKNMEISKNDKVHILYGNPGSNEFLSVEGHVTIVEDQEKIDELWTPIIKTWFQEGKDDPNLSLLKVTPREAYYWDTKNGKMVSLAKMLVSPIVGKTMDDGIEGELKL